jgi:membrane dipeptidase
MLLVDAHQDLAWNMLTFGRDYTRSAAETRRLEAGGAAPLHNGDTLLGWADYQAGRVAVIFATLFAAPHRRQEGDWDTQVYRDAQQAHRLYRAQLDAYHRLVERHDKKFRLVFGRADLQQVLEHWQRQELDFAPPPAQAGDQEPVELQGHPVGLVVLMEGAEGVRSPEELAEWKEWGVRLVGPAWAGTRFCGGTREPGSLTKEGFALLEGMAEAGLVLDLSHMDEQAALQALDVFEGRMVATHANARKLLPRQDDNRHLSDRLIQGLIERDAVIGIVPYNAFLDSGWRTGDPRQPVSIERAAAHIDHICQMAGDARHAGLGSDFDGGFGWQSAPHEINTIADLALLAGLLAQRGYSEADVAAILGQNWLRLLQETLPE